MFPDLFRIEIQGRAAGGEVLQKHLSNRISKRRRCTGNSDEPAHSSEDRNGFEQAGGDRRTQRRGTHACKQRSENALNLVF